MTTTLASFLTDLTDWQKAITALVGAASVGAMLALGGMAVVGLPERMDDAEQAIDANTATIITNTREVRSLEAKVDRILCLQLLPDSISHLEAQRECP